MPLLVKLAKHVYQKIWTVHLERLQVKQNRSMELFANFRKLAEAVRKQGGQVSFEWPRSATAGWLRPELVSFIQDFELFTTDFDGCDVGLKSRRGHPILKPWRIVTSSGQLAVSLARRRCHHPHDSNMITLKVVRQHAQPFIQNLCAK